MKDSLVTVTDAIGSGDDPRVPPIRWVVAATFVGIDGVEPRCVDYRVRVVPDGEPMQTLAAAHRIMKQLQDDAIGARDAGGLGDVPPGGIPRRVFEVASQTRLLAKASGLVQRRPERFTESTRALLAPQRRGPGRPPARSLAEKLRILVDVEDAFAASERTLEDVARQHNMSRSALRDLLGWARHDADPPLFVSFGPGRRGGHLTPEARALLDQLHEED